MQEVQVEGYRLSPQQRRLWLLNPRDEWHSYVAECIISIRGPAEPALLRRSLEEVAVRNEILRTAFRRAPGINVPLQILDDGLRPSVEYLDLSASTPAERKARVSEALKHSRRVPFNVANGPIGRFTLASFTAESHVVVLSQPALYADVRSLTNLAREIGRAYAALCSNEPIPDGQLQYIDLAAWQNELIESDETASGRDYWRRRTKGLPLDLRLPFESGFDTANEFVPESVRIEIEPELFRQLRHCAEDNCLSVESMLLGCWQVWVSRVTGTEHFVVSLLSDGRKAPGLAEALGPLSRCIPLECLVEEGACLRDLFQGVSESVREAEDWADYFSWDLFETDIASSEKAAFFPVCCEFFEMPGTYLAGNAEFSVVHMRACPDRFKLKLSCRVSSDGITADLVYDSAVLPPRAVDAAAKQFKALLVGLPQDLAARSDQLEMLGPEERKRLLIELNDTASSTADLRPTAVLIQDQAHLKPHGIAAETKTEVLSFEELNRTANQLAWYLRRQGITPGDIVALYMERSLDLLVSLLAVLKAGAAYLPIDPAWPQERVGFLIKEAGPKLVLTQTSFRPTVLFTGIRAFCPATEQQSFEHESGDAPAEATAPNSTAYVIYTSGSSGMPKGVMVTNEGLSNYITWCLSSYRIGDGSGAPVHSPISFDLTVTSLLAPLAGGRTVKLLPEADGVECLARALTAGDRYSLVKLTPAHLRLLSQVLPPSQIRNCTNVLVIGGEALFADDLLFWRRNAPDTRLVNEYGPTETVVGCCTFELPTDWSEQGGIPIGRPIASTRLYILNAAFSLQPSGTVGELYIGGCGVAAGYIKRPELTAERFIPDPYNSEPGARMYRSGDLVRLRPDGLIEYLGRNDHQVQVRGFRVELGEIEAVLLTHPAVRAAAVIVDASANTTRLEAFVELNGSRPVEPEQVIEFVRQKLPGYMAPTTVLALDQLPLNSNGKVDRRRLLSLGREALKKRPYTAPRTPAEALLAETWAQVLRLERVGIHDNFFDLGGDSILVIQAVARANRAGFSYEPHHILAHQTIGELAGAVCSNAGRGRTADQACGETPLTPIQEWFFEQDETDLNHYNQAVMLRAREPINPAALCDAVDLVVERHDALRSRFFKVAGGWNLVIAEREENRIFNVADLSSVSLQRLPDVIESIGTSVQTSLDIEEGPLVRVLLLHFGSAETTAVSGSNIEDDTHRRARILIVAHHLVIDAVSWGILFRDLEDGYLQLKKQGYALLGHRTSSYRGWAVRLKELAAEEWTTDQLHYWNMELGKQRAKLIADYPGKNLEGGSQIALTGLNEEQTEILTKTATTEYGADVRELLVVALVRGAEELFSQEQAFISIDIEGHGREAIGSDLNLARTVGWFTCIFPLLVELNRDEALHGLVQRVKRQIRSVPGGGLGYGLLRYLCTRDGRTAQLSGIHDSELIFNYLGFVGRELGSQFDGAEEQVGRWRSSERRRRYLVEVNAEIRSGKLEIEWVYGDCLSTSRVEAAAHRTVETLRLLIAQVRRTEPAGHIRLGPASSMLRQRDIQRIISSINRTEGPNQDRER